MRKSLREHNVKEAVYAWWNSDRRHVFIINGRAGTGKTTTAKTIPKILNLYSVAFLAPTGKAARMLHPQASTIHSYMYEPEVDPVTGKLTFHMKPRDSFFEQLLIVDEISMVNEELLRDLKSLYIPIIGLGDSAQLKPVNGESYILENPDITLKKIWRHDSGILELSEDIIEKRPLKSRYKDVNFRQGLYKDLKLMTDDSIVICRFNKTRQKINKMIRDQVYNYKPLIAIGEKLIILNNNRDSGLFNGSIVEVMEIMGIDNDYNLAVLIVKEDNYDQIIEVDLDILKGIESTKKKFLKKEGIHEVDYAYAITCHKAQGSEFDKVFIINQGQHFDDHINWFYTAVTRAKKKLFIYN